MGAPRAARLLGALAWLSAADAVHAQGRPAASLAEVATTERVLFAEDTARVTLRIASRAAVPTRFWVGYSLQDPLGRWHDAPARPVVVGPRSTSRRLGQEWPLPPDASLVGGEYRAVVAVWSAPPGTPGATRLDSWDRPRAFRVFRFHDADLRPPAWTAGSHPLGRGRVRARHAVAGPAGAELRLPRGRCDGAEIRSTRRFLYGSYAARIRVADAPGSLTAFFLYQDVPGGNDEIDVEITGDDRRRLLLSTWVAGKQTNHAELRLAFDPRAGFHVYGFDFLPGSLTFTVDGVAVLRWTEGLPRHPMRLMANAWWPVWMECKPSGGDRAALLSWIRG